MVVLLRLWLSRVANSGQQHFYSLGIMRAGECGSFMVRINSSELGRLAGGIKPPYSETMRNIQRNKIFVTFKKTMADLNFSEQIKLMLIDKAAIGCIIGVGAYWLNRKLESFRNQLSRKEESSKNLRLATAELVKKIAAGQHEITWLCWTADNCPEEITKEYLIAYDNQMKQIQSELVGLRVILATTDSKIHDLLTPFIVALFHLDGLVGQAKVLYRQSPEDGLKAFAELYSDSHKYENELVEVATNLKI
jgi:hypothetical protein